MRRLVLTPFLGGELAVWEKPKPGRQYIAACDPNIGRITSAKADTCCIGIWERFPGWRIRQAAELVFRWPAGRAGEVIGALARAYGGYWHADAHRERGNAIINIERNVCDLMLLTLQEVQFFPEQFFFVTRQARELLKQGQPHAFFTEKTQATQDFLLNNVIDYLDQDRLEIRSDETVKELRSLTKDGKGRVDTNGKDRAVMVMMACDADRGLEPVMAEAEAPKPAEVLPWGRIPAVEQSFVKVKRVPGARAKWAAWG